jgi:hypothetical protein
MSAGHAAAAAAIVRRQPRLGLRGRDDNERESRESGGFDNSSFDPSSFVSWVLAGGV